MSQQRGVFRVNCIDCLDRTNVVQSAFARNVLTSQLEALALVNESGKNQSEADYVFNDGSSSLSICPSCIEEVG